MPAFVALYRGINVGGNRPVKMEALRALHERLGHGSVRTYIQSGNVVFTATGSAINVSGKLCPAFKATFGFSADVRVLEAARYFAAVNNCPFADLAAANPKTVHVGFCDGAPDGERLKELLARHSGTETFEISAEVIYLHAPDGFGTSKFAAGMEKAAGVAMTVRNWRTIEKLARMIEAINEPTASACKDGNS